MPYHLVSMATDAKMSRVIILQFNPIINVIVFCQLIIFFK